MPEVRDRAGHADRGRIRNARRSGPGPSRAASHANTARSRSPPGTGRAVHAVGGLATRARACMRPWVAATGFLVDRGSRQAQAATSGARAPTRSPSSPLTTTTTSTSLPSSSFSRPLLPPLRGRSQPRTRRRPAAASCAVRRSASPHRLAPPSLEGSGHIRPSIDTSGG